MWRLLPHTTKKPRVFMDDDPRKNQAYLLKCNGELISIVVGPMGEFVRILRFYERTKTWQVVQSLDDRMVFLSLTGCVATTTCDNNENDDARIRELKNTIHFPRLVLDDNHVLYSISSGQFHSLDSEYTSDDLYGTKLPLNHAWMIPTFFIPNARSKWSSRVVHHRPPKPKSDATVHPHYVIRSLTFLQNKQPGEINVSNKQAAAAQQQEAPTARPCFVFPNEEEDEDLLVDLSNNGPTVLRNTELAARLVEMIVHSTAYRTLVLVEETGCSLLDPLTMIETPLPSWELTFGFSDVLLLRRCESESVVVVFGRYRSQQGKAAAADDPVAAMLWRDGDERWTRFAIPSKRGIDTTYGVAVYRGKIYGWYTSFCFAVMEFRHDGCRIEPVSNVGFPTLLHHPGSVSFRSALVESCDELLLLVRYYQHGCYLGYKYYAGSVPIDVKAFKMDSEAMDWKIVEDLGDRAFFWSMWGCYSCCASKSGLQRNCIYYLERDDMDLYAFDYGDRTVSMPLGRSSIDIDDWPLDAIFFMWYS
ncbi:unnamed protein product [Linum trigynum]|uniref:KIB1-4 beta-propeller domain-containing protein n=1 Tax=Linum trigynum TaxID=586398 RepID=A0AAV2DHC5_9ROSI